MNNRSPNKNMSSLEGDKTIYSNDGNERIDLNSTSTSIWPTKNIGSGK